MSEIRNLYLNEKGELIIKRDIIDALHLKDGKIECIVESDQIILRNPLSLTEKLFGCCGKEKKEDYDFHAELKC